MVSRLVTTNHHKGVTQKDRGTPNKKQLILVDRIKGRTATGVQRFMVTELELFCFFKICDPAWLRLKYMHGEECRLNSGPKRTTK